ncbi:MAG: DoxX family protein [Actinomycetota bacterium]|nr:DoxX family protein [Actinomycetota bacterium]
MTQKLDAGLARLHSPALALFRIVLGLLFALHGSMKLFGWPSGEPIPVGTWPYWWAGLIELVTGLLIAVGLFTRIAALLASGTMAVAYFWQHWGIVGGELGSFWPPENGGELPVIYCFGFLLLAATGAGALSIDGIRGGRTSATAGT